MAEIVALASGGILLLVALVCLVIYMIKYVKLYGLINLLINIVWIVVGISALALYISMWFINLRLIGGITVLALMFVAAAVIGIAQSDK